MALPTMKNWFQKTTPCTMRTTKLRCQWQSHKSSLKMETRSQFGPRKKVPMMMKITLR